MIDDLDKPQNPFGSSSPQHASLKKQRRQSSNSPKNRSPKGTNVQPDPFKISPIHETPRGSPSQYTTPTGTPNSHKIQKTSREVIGEGSSGCIVYPSLAYPKDPNMVGKWIADKKTAEIEYNIATVLKNIDVEHKYLLYPIRITEGVDPPEYSVLDRCNALEKRHRNILMRRKKAMNSPPLFRTASAENEIFFYELAMPRGSSWNYLRMNRKEFLASIYHILQGIEILQGAGYVHQDLEPKNIVMVNNTSRIIDFSECKKIKHVYQEKNLDKLENLSPILPPESLVYTKKMDSVGSFLHRMDTSGFHFKELWMNLHEYSEKKEVKSLLLELAQSKSIPWSEYAMKMDIYAIGTIMLTYLSVNNIKHNQKNKKIFELAKQMTMLHPEHRISVGNSIARMEELTTQSRSSS